MSVYYSLLVYYYLCMLLIDKRGDLGARCMEYRDTGSLA